MTHDIKLSEKTILRYLKNSTVAGIGIGYKVTNGQTTDTLSAIVFVNEKLPKQKVTSQELIPRRIEDLPTDVIQSGPITKQVYEAKIRPIKPGYSCGHGQVTAGTIGGFFLDKDNHPVILSNNHILANENGAAIGDLIYQPGPFDNNEDLTYTGWDRSPSDLPYFATLKDFTPINFAGSNTHDSATAIINNAFTQANMVNLEYPSLNLPLNGFGNAALGMVVQKVGRTTGHTTGSVIALNSTFSVGFSSGNATFTNCIVFSNMSAGGDSGSIICDNSMNAVALLFAGSGYITLGNDINTVKNRYGLKLYSQNPPLQYHSTNAALKKAITRSHSTSALLRSDSMSLGDGKWSTLTSRGTIINSPNRIDINAPANSHCLQFRRLTSLNHMQITINTGTDTGAIYGPGLVLTWPNKNTYKLNFRTGGHCTSVINGIERAITGLGRITAKTSYTVRIRSVNSTYISELLVGNNWRLIATIPKSTFSGTPTILTVGKTSIKGGAGDAARLGPSGTCHFRDLQI